MSFKIEFPTNPNIYLIIFGFILLITGLIFISINFVPSSIIIFSGMLLLLFSYLGLKKEHNLRLKNIEKDIELKEKKINEINFDYKGLFGR